MSESKKELNKGMAVLAYVLFLVPLLTDAKNDEYVKFHLKQSIGLVVTAIAVNVVGAVVPVLGWFVIAPLGGIVVFVLWIIGVLNAMNGEKKPLPLIGKFAEENLKF